jgi:hypothetical protein
MYMGRPIWSIPAAQGGANSGTIAFAFALNSDQDKPTKAAVDRCIRAAWSVRRNRGVRRLGGHREAPGQSTACPGRNLFALLGSIAKRAQLRRV